MKRLSSIFISLMLATTVGWAQSGMTDNQVMDYVIEQNAKGTSRQQIVTQLMQRGVTIDQIRRIQKKYQRQTQNGALGAEDITSGSKGTNSRMREANGDLREERKISSHLVRDGRPQNSDRQFTEMDEAMDFMMPDSLKYNQEKEEKPGRKIFGHDVFNNKNLTFESSMNLATPHNYRLGPGDVVNIDIWGASQQSVSETRRHHHS